MNQLKKVMRKSLTSDRFSLSKESQEKPLLKKNLTRNDNLKQRMFNDLHSRNINRSLN